MASLLEDLAHHTPETQSMLLKFAATVYLTITLREKAEGMLYSLQKRLHAGFEVCPEMREWMVGLFSQPLVLDEFFKNCIIREIKKLLAFWLADLYIHCAPRTQQMFCNAILTQLTNDHENSLEYCIILHQVAKNHPESLDYLARQAVVGRLLENMGKKDDKVYVDKLECLEEEKSEIGNEVVIEKSPQELNAKKWKLDNENGYIWGLINLGLRRAAELNLSPS